LLRARESGFGGKSNIRGSEPLSIAAEYKCGCTIDWGQGGEGTKMERAEKQLLNDKQLNGTDMLIMALLAG
jgi:hypothetical protein